MNNSTRQKFAILLGLAVVGDSAAQVEYGNRLGLQQGAEARLMTLSPEVYLAALDPAVRRWYVPQELYEEHRWRQWQYTNRARLPYRRYVEVDLQGDYFYDLYGNYLTQGWLVFNTAQTRPQEAGSTLFKTNVFDRWFNQLVIAGDRKGPVPLRADGEQQSAHDPDAAGLFQAALERIPTGLGHG